MNETIYDLIDAIKEDKRYLQFKEQSLKLLNQETKELLDNYQNLLQELDDLKKFEKYIYEHRPYLNPDLRITDLMQAFHTNRTYISRFINREYGMNFSRYINMLRLREMEALRNDPACSRLPEEERACLAGFSNFRSYQRVKRMAEKENRSCFPETGKQTTYKQ